MSIGFERVLSSSTQDFQDLLAIYQANPDALTGLANGTQQTADIPGLLQEILANTGDEIRAVRFNSRLIAAAIISRSESDTIEIQAIAVRPSSAGRDLPSRLLCNTIAAMHLQAGQQVRVQQPADPVEHIDPQSLQDFHVQSPAPDILLLKPVETAE